MAIFDVFFGFSPVAFVIGIATFFLSLWYSVKKQSYWKDRNVPYVKPLPFLGSLIEILTKPLHEVYYKRYFSLGPIHGSYEANSPILCVGDPKLIRDILVKDFSIFPIKRHFKTGDKIKDKMVITLQDEDHKRVRSLMTPAFTTGKLKMLLDIFKECSKTLVQNFKLPAGKNEDIDIKKLLGAFSMDVIASSAFTTKIDSHNDPDNKFVLSAKKIFSQKLNWWKILLRFLPKLITKFLKLLPNFFSSNVDFFINVITQIVTERKQTKQSGNDFLQLLMDATGEKTTNDTKDDAEVDDITAIYGKDFSGQKLCNTKFNKSLTIDELVAQCVVFFLAGYETTSTLLTYVLYCLALNQDMQEKAYQEIKQCLQETDGELTYETLRNMSYLENIMSETLRLYSPFVKTDRRTVSEYKLGDTGIVLEKDMMVIIPIYAIHRDPKYYPNPEKFDPNRFTPEERAKRDTYTYLPFGHGPRNCIGMRFALLEVKVCLTYIISCFNIKTCPKTSIPLKFRQNYIGMLKPAEVFLRLDIRKDWTLNF